MALNEDLLDKIDHSIRKGDFSTAKKVLDSIAISKTPERLVIRLSDLLTRAGMFKHNIKLLYPFMFNNVAPANPRITARYALNLQQIGAYHEASRIFEDFDFPKAPEANFYYAITLFSKWDYSEATKYLKKYLQAKELSVYERLVGKVNLIQSHLGSGDYTDGESLLKEVESEIEKPEYNLLRANCFQLKAQLLYAKKEFQKALQLLSSSEKMLKTFPSHYQLTVRFWQMICQLALNPESNQALKAFKELRQKSVKLGRWALVRQCDYYRSMIEQNEELFLKVYFGTPFPAYRKRLEQSFGKKITIPEHYLWNPTEKKAAQNNIVDVTEGLDLNSGSRLKRGQVPHRLLQTLSSDFYINFKLETIASYVFPDEHYNPSTSYKRAFTAVSKLQKWFKDNKIPIQVKLNDDGYRIYFVDPYVMKVRLAYDNALEFDPKSDLLSHLADNELYSARELSGLLKIPLRTIYRKLGELVNNNQLVREKFGNEVKYRKN